MSQYLNRFKDLIRKRQAEQVLKLLSKQKNSGQIASVEEFTTKLNTLVRELNQSTLTPTLKLFAAGEVTDPESYNFMLDRTEDDLKAAFEEAINISEVQDAHQKLIKDVVLENIRRGLLELENKINVYEFLNRTNYGFDNALYSSFKESKNDRSTRDIEQDEVIFKDPRSGLIFNSSEDAVIDPVGEYLALKDAESKNIYKCTSVKRVFDADMPNPTIPDMWRLSYNIDCLIDNKPLPTFSAVIYSKDRQPYSDFQFEFELDGIHAISSIDVLAQWATWPQYLESIQYIDSSGQVQTAENPHILIGSKLSYNFDTIYSNKIILTFRTESPIFYEYIYSTEVLKTSGRESDVIPAYGYTDRKVIWEVPFRSIFPGGTPEAYKVIKTLTTYWGYELMLQEVSFGQSNHTQRSVYVSKPIQLNDVGQVGLKVKEKRPALVNGTISLTSATYDANEQTVFNGSIEYWVVCQNLDAKNNIVSNYTFPVLPSGTTRINHERLLLSERSTDGQYVPDTGYTCFFTTKTSGDVKVYKNGNLLNEEEWLDISEDVDRTPNSGKPMRLKVKIIDPYHTDIFTISYTPLESTTLGTPGTLLPYSDDGLNIIDLSGNLTARLGENKLVMLDKGTEADRIDKSKFYLVIILRGNSSINTLSPIVEEYTLALGSKQADKFKGL